MGRLRDQIYERQCSYCNSVCITEALLTRHEKVCIFKSKNCRQQIVDMLEEVVSDTMDVFNFGAKKHPDSGEVPNFLTPEGNKCSLSERGSSVLRHAARTFMFPDMKDEESNLSELLHLMASVSILYIRHKRGIRHPLDEVKHAVKTS